MIPYFSGKCNKNAEKYFPGNTIPNDSSIKKCPLCVIGHHHLRPEPQNIQKQGSAKQPIGMTRIRRRRYEKRIKRTKQTVRLPIMSERSENRNGKDRAGARIRTKMRSVRDIIDRRLGPRHIADQCIITERIGKLPIKCNKKTLREIGIDQKKIPQKPSRRTGTDLILSIASSWPICLDERESRGARMGRELPRPCMDQSDVLRRLAFFRSHAIGDMERIVYIRIVHIPSPSRVGLRRKTRTGLQYGSKRIALGKKRILVFLGIDARELGEYLDPARLINNAIWRIINAYGRKIRPHRLRIDCPICHAKQLASPQGKSMVLRIRPSDRSDRRSKKSVYHKTIPGGVSDTVVLIIHPYRYTLDAIRIVSRDGTSRMGNAMTDPSPLSRMMRSVPEQRCQRDEQDDPYKDYENNSTTPHKL